jgi:hypothetical protein
MRMRIPNGIWGYLEKKGYVDEASYDFERKEDPVAWLANEAGLLIDAAEVGDNRREVAEGFVPSRRRQRRQKGLPLRREVISELLAGIARRSADVTAFRENVLAERLLKHEEVAGWIGGRVDESRYPIAVLVRLPPDLIRIDENGEFQLPPGALEGLPIESLAPHEVLEYSRPGAPWVEHIPIGRDGALNQLRLISERLALVFGWQKAQATVFVLTDDVPLLPGLMITLSWGSVVRDLSVLRHLRCLARLTLTIDPLMAPSEVAEQYRKTRRSILLKKLRALSEKQMHLAAFCCDLPALKQPDMKAWNKEYPHWTYCRFSNFSRDAKRAHTRLLDLPLRADFKALF